MTLNTSVPEIAKLTPEELAFIAPDIACKECNFKDVVVVPCAACSVYADIWLCGALPCIIVHYRRHHASAIDAACTYMTGREQRTFKRLLEYVK